MIIYADLNKLFSLLTESKRTMGRSFVGKSEHQLAARRYRRFPEAAQETTERHSTDASW